MKRFLSVLALLVLLAFLASDGQLALSGSWDKTLKLWEVGLGR